eukprot:TRINITY_DN417_c0_g1_i1.p1 TRINITY_DN417_c0_g1~~TRINITY_DN417_c0_g1_i1.p1  ORF type:complete len:441 (-),score=122.80 TRINITY_DN417_c0_g1_i1:150-1448(-)
MGIKFSLMLVSFLKRSRPLAFRPFSSTNYSIWDNIQLGPADPILGLTEAFKKDTDKRKVSLGAGTYRDDENKPYVLECVKKAIVINDKKYPDFEYLGVDGLPAFVQSGLKLAYGENSNTLKAGNIAGCQALSGTGSLRLGGVYLKRFVPNAVVYLPDETWPNHRNIFRDSGLEMKNYRYYDPNTRGLNQAGLLEDLRALPRGSVVVLHASAHNPTGVDPTQEQWLQIRDIVKERGLIPFFDMAYQGFTSGSPDRDAFALRAFDEAGIPLLLAQSFAKNFGLYGTRTGIFSITCGNSKQAEAILSQLKILARPIWSSPPINGARIVETILNTPELDTLWRKEVKIMADRIASMRTSIVDNLRSAGSQHNWSHITNQIGMFAYTGLNKEQVNRLREEFRIYLTLDGRISIAGLNTKNVQYVANAFHEVTKNARF